MSTLCLELGFFIACVSLLSLSLSRLVQRVVATRLYGRTMTVKLIGLLSFGIRDHKSRNLIARCVLPKPNTKRRFPHPPTTQFSFFFFFFRPMNLDCATGAENRATTNGLPVRLAGSHFAYDCPGREVGYRAGGESTVASSQQRCLFAFQTQSR